MNIPKWQKINYLNGLFSDSRRRYKRLEIQERFENYFDQPLPRRTFHDYIKELRDKWKAPIESERIGKGKELYYWYEYKFAPPQVPLTHEDTRKLKSISSLLSGLPQLPHIEDLKAIVATLEHQVSLKAADSPPIFFLEHRPNSAGSQYLGVLGTHIQNKKVLKITYLSFKNHDKPKTFTIHPYFLRENQRYWYLFGWCEEFQRLGNYALDRIQFIEIAQGRTFIPMDFDPKTYFEDILGVTHWNKFPIETYRIRANTEIAPYWRSRPLHQSQEQDSSDSQIFQFKLRWNHEWQNWVLYYGDNIEILEPAWFRERIRKIHYDAWIQYDVNVMDGSLKKFD